ncbi:PREDICTED: 30S ribosomal S18 [Prunus dulcis]|uniref:Small ribosomal subunit protein bS18c n=1 Tax=Prunus dulcis TaxID=3755 RepID=A0A5E4FXB6_PRUDU|nr:uncharacterized protein LOC117632923 isoform X1 [Prunus dulcis]XP_034222454.1 uncharacterized protein LOC117632923 isoform X1 [Prunus dulcis]VVA32089.1 PREDICTED: 30S ribosomal S18 [Prunus dulcis]
MKGVRFALRSFNDGVSRRFHQPHMRTLSTNVTSGGEVDDENNSNSFESPDEFERRIFGETSGGNFRSDAFFTKLDRLGMGHDGQGLNPSGGGGSGSGSGSHILDGLDESFNTLSDGMDGKLEKAAADFDIDYEEINQEGYSYRPDVNFELGTTYDLKDLDLTKRGVRKFTQRDEFEVTTKEVLRKADFRNVRFLANFLTDAGILIKRSKTGISAKAQRKVAREIKTARAFGLMPFTTMGTKSFVFGKTMEALDQDYEYESYDNPMDADGKDPLGPF